MEPFTRSAEPTPAQMAYEFLREGKYLFGTVLNMRFWRREFYKFTGTHYRRVTEQNLLAEVLQWFHRAKCADLCKTTKVNNLMINLKGICRIPDELELNSWIDNRPQSASALVSVKNGIIGLDNLIKGDANSLIPHSSELFTLASLPFPYDPSAACPRWENFLLEMLVDHEVIGFLQEWIGYNLIFDTKQEKFVLFVGEGANGKSVVCAVMRALLGLNNVSAVSLEAFSPGNRFGLASTVGKLANLMEEMNEIEKTSEGNLKNFVTGGLIEAERKQKDAFPFYPTARLTFATNVLPRFNDRTDALWRRLIVIHFSIQITDESKQDKRLLNAEYWMDEMPGILNWALNGLISLRERGHFIEPRKCKEFKASYKRESNPAKTYLLENFEERQSAKISSAEIYAGYVAYMRSNGLSPLRSPEFSKEIPRVFKRAEKSSNAHRQTIGGRSHEWTGIGPIIGSGGDTDGTDFSKFSNTRV